MNPVWKITLFGELRGIHDTGADFAPGVSRAGALFAYLALSPGKAHSRYYLAALFWPDADAAMARTRLRQELSNLRKLLEPEDISAGSVLTRERDSLALVSGAIVTDVEVFRKVLSEARSARNDRERERFLETAVTLKDGKLIAKGAVGVRKYGDSTPVTKQDQFHLGSCTKALTAHLCALLMEEKN